MLSAKRPSCVRPIVATADPMIELDLVGESPLEERELRGLCAVAARSMGVEGGHLAIEFVDARRIAELNERHRGKAGPTDVLSFPIDGAEPTVGERELGDVVVCLAQADDVREAVVHGVLHLLGMDHETDDGEMLALQRRLLAAADVEM
jgi:probable rRNA maturation factor